MYKKAKLSNNLRIVTHDIKIVIALQLVFGSALADVMKTIGLKDLPIFLSTLFLKVPENIHVRKLKRR